MLYKVRQGRDAQVFLRAATIHGYSHQCQVSENRLSRGHYGCIERGEIQPSLWLILMISAALGSSSSELMADTQVNLKRRN